MKTVNQRAKEMAQEVTASMSQEFKEFHMDLEELFVSIYLAAAAELQEFIPISDNKHLELNITEMILLKTTSHGLYLGYYDKERNRFVNSHRAPLNAIVASFRPLTHKIEL